MRARYKKRLAEPLGWKQMIKVVIDPGHGGWDPGAIGPTGVKEKIITLGIAKKIIEYFDPNCEIRLTREKDIALGKPVSEDLKARAGMANRWGADLFVSIHCNSSVNKNAKGIEVFCYSIEGKGGQLAKSIHSSIISALGLTDRGVKTSNFAVLRQTIMPACLVEVAFISNPAEEALLDSSDFQASAALAIARGIGGYLGIEPKQEKGEVDDWKLKIVQEAKEAGLIASDHNPDEPASKWFVLAVALNILKKIKS